MLKILFSKKTSVVLSKKKTPIEIQDHVLQTFRLTIIVEHFVYHS